MGPNQAPLPSHCPYEAYAVNCSNGNAYDGYWLWTWWVPGYVSNETWFRQTPAYSSGRLVWYAPGLMRATAEYRGLSLDGYVDGVALMSPMDIGKTVYIHREGHGWEGPFLVVDCARRTDIYAIIRYRKEVIEVGWDTKQAWGLTEPIEVTIVLGDPYQVTEKQQSVNYPDWWMERVTFTPRWEPSPLFIFGGGWILR